MTEPITPTPVAPAIPAPPTYVAPTEDEWQRVQASLAKLNAEQKTARETALAKARAEGAEGAAVVAKAEAAAERDAHWRAKIIPPSVRAALTEAGAIVPGDMVAMIDPGKLTVDDDGTVVGIEAQVAALKSRAPMLFATKPATQQAVNAGDARNAHEGRSRTTAEKLRDQLLNKA